MRTGIFHRFSNLVTQVSKHKNTVFSIYLFCLAILSGIFLYLKDQKELATLSLEISAPQCRFAEVFFNTSPQISLDPAATRRIPLKSDELSSTEKQLHSLPVPLPIEYLRLDPCEGKQDVEIASIVMSHRDQTVRFGIEELARWECHGCTASSSATGLHVQALNNDPIIIQPKIHEQLMHLNEPVKGWVYIKTVLLPWLLSILVVLPLLFLLSKKLLVIMILVGTILTAALFFITRPFVQAILRAVTRRIFPPAPIGAEEIIGYAQYNGVSIRFEFYVFLLTGAGIAITLASMYFIQTYFFSHNESDIAHNTKKVRKKS